MIVAAGGTGTVGSEVVARLARAGHRVRVLSRSPGRALPAPAGVHRTAGTNASVGTTGPNETVGTARSVGTAGTVETVHADLDDRVGLCRALEGASAVLIVLANPLRPAQNGNLLDAARRAGARRAVRLSALAVADGAEDLITSWHRRGEEELRASGLDWTVLRPRAFMSNTLGWATGIRTHGAVSVPCGQARNACVDPEDIAEVAVRALTEPGHAGRVYGLTGPAAISPAEQAEQLSALLGRPLTFRELGPDEAREQLLRRYPAVIVDALAESAERLAAGAKVEVLPTVEQVTGRPARSFHDWALAHLDHFR